MAINIANCPRCGKVFAKGIKDVCPACVKDIDAMYEQCVKYLRENRGATIHDLSEATKVSIKQITAFIREGRISLASNPNMGYPCDVCGIMIREKTMCDLCRQRLTRDVNQLTRQNQPHSEAHNPNGPGYQIRDQEKN